MFSVLRYNSEKGCSPKTNECATKTGNLILSISYFCLFTYSTSRMIWALEMYFIRENTGLMAVCSTTNPLRLSKTQICLNSG